MLSAAVRSLLLLSCLIAVGPARAQVARQFSSATYTGMGGAQASADFDNLDEAINLDAVGGFRITPDLAWGSLSAELNLAVTVSPGKNQGQPSGTGGVLGGGTSCTPCTADADDLAMQNLGLYLVYRTPGRYYALALAGYGLVNTSIDEISERGRSALGYGAGLGFRFGQETAAIELLYQQVSEDLQTIGLRLVY